MSKATLALRTPQISPEKLADTVRECAPIWQKFQQAAPDFVQLPYADPRPISLLTASLRARQKFDAVVVLGIGGSSLGGQAVVAALATARGLPVHFLDNLDPQSFLSTLRSVKLSRTLFLIISKSGDTLETVTQLFWLQKKLGKNWQRHVVIITDAEKGFLRTLATKEKLPSLPVPAGVGGRYSVLSPVGLLPAALAGVNVRELLAGAREAPAAEAFQLACTAAELFAGGRSVAVFCPYVQALKKIGEWHAQLLAESVGKGPRVGLTPEVSVGVTDQHSKLQLWLDGPDDKFYFFVRTQKWARDLPLPLPPRQFAFLRGHTFGSVLAAEYTGTVTALAEKRRPLAEFVLPEIAPRHVGWLLQFLMLEVAFLGQILEVNPFDQPAVERGKVLALAELRRRQKPSSRTKI